MEPMVGVHQQQMLMMQMQMGQLAAMQQHLQQQQQQPQQQPQQAGVDGFIMSKA